MVENLNDWQQDCLKNIAALGGTACSDDVCSSSLGFAADYCTCSGAYSAYKVNGKCPFSADTPIPILTNNCYCCCGTAIYTNLASAESEDKTIRVYKIGDTVWAANNLALTDWGLQPVLFNADSGGILITTGFVVIFEKCDGTRSAIMCPRDQLFLLANRRLKAAEDLELEQDTLLAADNSALTIVAILTSASPVELYCLATSTSPATSVAGHLLIANGVMIADYALQIAVTTGRAVAEYASV